MGQILLPKQYHPDFAQPGKKPIGPVEIDRTNKFGAAVAYAFLAPNVNPRQDSANTNYTVKVDKKGQYFHFEREQPSRLQWESSSLDSAQEFTSVTVFTLPEGMSAAALIYNISSRLLLAVSRTDIGITSNNVGGSFFTGSAFAAMDLGTLSSDPSTVYAVVLSKASGEPLSGVLYKNGIFSGSSSTTETNDIAYAVGRNNSLGTNGSWTVEDNNQQTGVYSHAFLPRTSTLGQQLELGGNPYQILKPDTAQIYNFPSAAVTSVTTGTAVPTQTEAEVVTGGKTIILTLTGDTWVAAGTGPIGSTADTQAIIDGLTAAATPTNGWNNEVRDKEVTTAVVRTSNTVCTITLTAAAAYDVAATETITATIPAAALVTSASPVVSSPTFTVTAVVAAGLLLINRSIANFGGMR
jgi:hypothetical protein